MGYIQHTPCRLPAQARPVVFQGPSSRPLSSPPLSLLHYPSPPSALALACHAGTLRCLPLPLPPAPSGAPKAGAGAGAGWCIRKSNPAPPPPPVRSSSSSSSYSTSMMRDACDRMRSSWLPYCERGEDRQGDVDQYLEHVERGVDVSPGIRGDGSVLWVIERVYI